MPASVTVCKSVCVRLQELLQCRSTFLLVLIRVCVLSCLQTVCICSHSAHIKATASVASAAGTSKKSSSSSKLVLFTDRAFDTEVDRIEAGATADTAAAAFARVLVAPDAPASVGASYLNARLRCAVSCQR